MQLQYTGLKKHMSIQQQYLTGMTSCCAGLSILDGSYRDGSLSVGAREGEGRPVATRALQLQSARTRVEQRVGCQFYEAPLHQAARKCASEMHELTQNQLRTGTQYRIPASR